MNELPSPHGRQLTEVNNKSRKGTVAHKIMTLDVCVYVTGVCVSVCLCVCVSVTHRWDHTQDIFAARAHFPNGLAG